MRMIDIRMHVSMKRFEDEGGMRVVTTCTKATIWGIAQYSGTVGQESNIWLKIEELIGDDGDMNIERMTWGTDHPTAEISGLGSTAERAQLGNEFTCFREFGFGFDQDTIVNGPSLFGKFGV